MRHDKVCAHLQYSVCKALGSEMADTGTHTCPSQCMNRKMLVSWNQAVHTNREVTKYGPVIIIKNKKEKNIYTDRCGSTCRQKCYAKGNRKGAKLQEFMYRDTMNVEPEM